VKNFYYLCIGITTQRDFIYGMNYKIIGETIKERRKSLKIDQPTLAALAGVGVNTVVAVERGNGNAKIETILALLDTLGLKFDISLKD